MLPTLTVARARLARPWRLAAAAVVFLATLLAGTQMAPSGATPVPRDLADELAPATWAMTVPSSWLAGPIPAVRAGDRLDLLAVRSGERTYALPVAFGIAVLSVDERGLSVQVDEQDALAIANARAAGGTFVALLRSTR